MGGENANKGEVNPAGGDANDGGDVKGGGDDVPQLGEVVPEPKNNSLDGVPRLDGKVEAGLQTMVSVPLVSLTPPPPELIIALLLGGCALLTVAVLFPPIAMDFFLSDKLH